MVFFFFFCGGHLVLTAGGAGIRDGPDGTLWLRGEGVRRGEEEGVRKETLLHKTHTSTYREHVGCK